MHGSTWTSEETVKLVSMWPTHTAGQISRALHRPRSSVCGKASRLGLLGLPKHLDFDPHQVPPPRRGRPRPRLTQVAPPPPPPPVDDDDAPEMRPCTINELNDRRCKWPLGQLEQVAVLFCGAEAAKGQRYCPYHARLGRGDQGR